MSDIKSFRDLIAWQKAMDLAEHCYLRSLRFPSIHQYSLGSEIRKSSVSIPSNVAEGKGRHYTAAYINHLWYANGSDCELQTQLELARRVRVITEMELAAFIADAEEVSKIIQGLANSLEARSKEK
jgi:four helix bundle protein